MKLSLVFELLLIFVLLAFAASKSVKKQNNNKKNIQKGNEDDKLEENSINKYCKCVEAYCNCCRDFAVPVVNLNGPGCASLMYLNGDKMSVSLSFGKKVITNRTLSSRKPSPVCMPLPGGISKFCGRVYNIARAGEEFRACLGLELQSKSTVEAAVRVSCFKFGPRGVTSEPADPLPLVPQDEKNDDDEDDDDDDDDFDLGDDDDDDEDDDDDGELDAVNDVESADYTGFSLLGEDILGDLFGTAGGKKTNKNKNKKKQAPVPTTSTTTTTKRPRPTRRPPIRPARTTTRKPIKSTTVRIRPVNRRPTRRPNRRRPTRKPATTTEAFSTSILTTTPKIVLAEISSTAALTQTTERSQIINTANDETFEPIIGIAQRPSSISAVTTPKSVTGFEDTDLEMSLAHITGQLSVMPVTPMIANDPKDSSINSENKDKDQVSYEKVETITPKAPSTVAFPTTLEEVLNDDMIQIVQTLDSQENIPSKESMNTDESRAYFFNYNNGAILPNNYYGGIQLPKKKQRNEQFQMADLDVLDLTKIGMTVGDQLGIFGKNKRQNRHNQDAKIKGEKDTNSEYDDIVEDLSDSLMIKKSHNGNKNKKDRRRQNKMMRGEWASV